VDAIVLAPGTAVPLAIAGLRSRVPGIPLIAYAPFRPDDGELLAGYRRQQVAAVAIEGVDDAVVGELVARCSLTSARRRAMADGPRALRLTEPLQRLAWDFLVGAVERPVRTAELARRLSVSREYLSRQFGAGGAPNLKRVIDLTRVACAAQLLQNPGYTPAAVVRLLHFASSSHLATTSRRIAGVTPGELGALGPRGALAAFVRGNTRSRR
jgi:AraC-like DNA-binding protein